MTINSSRIPGFYQLSPRERLRKVADLSGLDATGEAHLADTGNLPAETADSMIENVIGTLNIPIGVATNLMIDGEDNLLAGSLFIGDVQGSGIEMKGGSAFIRAVGYQGFKSASAGQGGGFRRLQPR